MKEFGAIDYVSFSPIEPHHFAVTSSVRIQVYNPITKLVVKNLSRFRENAYGGEFRYNGKLLCSGSEEACVKLFDVSSKSLLRLFKGHTAPVHRAHFVHGKPQIASFSDDKTVKVWDIATETATLTYSNHNDYIRAGAVSSVAPDVVLSGSYDNTVSMYDTRTNKTVFTVDHGSPVESLLFLPSGGIFLSAGGTEIKIWDTFGGGKLLGNISQHHKTITCLHLAQDGKRLLSGSLDRHIKIYDVSTFKVVHTLDYPNAVLSLGISKDDATLVAGLVDGLVCISRREEDDTKLKDEKKAVSYKYMTHSHQSVDEVVSELDFEKQSKYDVCLRKFEYSKALDRVLQPYVVNKSPQITVSVMMELIRRRGLHRAFKGRETKSLLQILRFLLRNITNYRFTRVLIDVFNIFLDVYEESIHLMPPEVMSVVQEISVLLKQEVALGNELGALQGTLSLLLAASSSTEMSCITNKTAQLNLVPSADAQKNLVVNLT